MPSELQPILNPTDPRAIARAVKDTSLFLGVDRARAVGLPETDGTTPRTVTIQLIDRVEVYKTGRFWLRLMFGTAPFTMSSGLTVTVLSASASFVPVADQLIEVLTNEDGTVALEVDYVGSWYITASIGLEATDLGEISNTTAAAPATPITRLLPGGWSGRRV